VFEIGALRASFIKKLHNNDQVFPFFPIIKTIIIDENVVLKCDNSFFRIIFV